jgi:hypothetical protein
MLRLKWHTIVCPACGLETEYSWRLWQFYVEMRGDGIPCDARPGECKGRVYPPKPAEDDRFYEDPTW